MAVKAEHWVTGAWLVLSAFLVCLSTFWIHPVVGILPLAGLAFLLGIGNARAIIRQERDEKQKEEGDHGENDNTGS